MTHEQAEVLFLMEAKFAQPLASLEDLASWVDEVAALAGRYLVAGGTFRELQERFADVRTPFGGRFFVTEGWP